MCSKLCGKMSKNMLLLEKTEKYIKEKISIEYIIKKLNEVDKLKFSVFNKDQLVLFNTIPNPNFNEIFSEYDDSTNKMNYIDQLWRKFEFYQPNVNEEASSYKNISSQMEQNVMDANILNLINRVNFNSNSDV